MSVIILNKKNGGFVSAVGVSVLFGKIPQNREIAVL